MTGQFDGSPAVYELFHQKYGVVPIWRIAGMSGFALNFQQKFDFAAMAETYV